MKLSLGPDVLSLLLPHRRPMAMVDRVDSYSRPQLKATKLISANDPVFDGHFPGLHLWPGGLTIEGLAQAANVLTAIMALEDAANARGEPRDGVVRALCDLERRFKLEAAPSADAQALERQLSTDPLARMGFTTRIDIKLLRPVFAGQQMTYDVTLTHVAQGMGRFDVSATVEGAVVASGSLTGAAGWQPGE
jgi:3-hydroxyacyl-[acyl-carrier-protein] dehydratase